MIWASVVNTTTAEKGYRSAVNSATATLTITAGSIAIGSPVILETSTASLNGYNVRRPATSTSLVNNLFQGIVARVPQVNPTYLDREQEGLVQVYGYYPTAIVQRLTAGSAVGACLIPESLQMLIAVSGPVTADATGTAGNVEVPAIGCLAVLAAAIGTSSATETTTAPVWLRCL